MSNWIKIIGTQTGKFILGLTGVTLKNNAGALEVKNNADSAFAGATVETLKVTNNTAGFGNTFRTQATQAADYVYDLPLDDGSPSQVLATDGSGVLTWISVSTSQNWTAETTSFAFGSASTVTMFTLPANSLIDKVTVIIDTAFDGAPSLSIGVSGGSASKYVGSGDTLLTVADRYDMPNQSIPVGTSEDLEIYYTAGGATVGAGRVIVSYAVPV